MWLGRRNVLWDYGLSGWEKKYFVFLREVAHYRNETFFDQIYIPPFFTVPSLSVSSLAYLRLNDAGMQCGVIIRQELLIGIALSVVGPMTIPPQRSYWLTWVLGAGCWIWMEVDYLDM